MWRDLAAELCSVGSKKLLGARVECLYRTVVKAPGTLCLPAFWPFWAVVVIIVIVSADR